MDNTRQDSATRIRTKKVKKISLLNTTTETIWKPTYGRKFILTGAIVLVREHVGTNSDLANITLDNGTDGQTLVTALDVTPIVTGGAQRLTVIGNHLITYDTPLRIKKPDAAGGSTTYDIDLILTALELSEVVS